MDETRLKEIYGMLILANQETFDGKEFDAAYHSLAAASQCAAALNDVELLQATEVLAASELARIDSQHPEYQHSSASASQRGMKSVFEILGMTIKTKLQAIKDSRLSHNP